MRLSKPDTNDPTKRRHFEISIDSPFHILSCRATQANISLPAYTSPESGVNGTHLYDCGCPGAARRRNSPAVYPAMNALNAANSNMNNQEPFLERPPPPSHAHPQHISTAECQERIPPANHDPCTSSAHRLSTHPLSKTRHHHLLSSRHLHNTTVSLHQRAACQTTLHASAIRTTTRKTAVTKATAAVVSISLLRRVVACTGVWTLGADGCLWGGEVVHD
jgi:hypothetical protein